MWRLPAWRGLKGVTSGQKGGGRCPKKSGKRG